MGNVTTSGRTVELSESNKQRWPKPCPTSLWCSFNQTKHASTWHVLPDWICRKAFFFFFKCLLWKFKQSIETHFSFTVFQGLLRYEWQGTFTVEGRSYKSAYLIQSHGIFAHPSYNGVCHILQQKMRKVVESTVRKEQQTEKSRGVSLNQYWWCQHRQQINRSPIVEFFWSLSH